MRINRSATYGILATVYIAEQKEGKPLRGRDMAKNCGVSVEYLLKILQQLVRSQVLRSERGRGGGFFLRKPPAKTTLLEIIEAVEGPIIGEFNPGRKTKVPTKSCKKVERLCEDLAAYSRSKLERITVKQLMG